MACALFGFMACTQNPIEEQSAIRTDAPETLRVGFEDDETRIQLNEAQKTVWTKDDLVSVFYRSDANQKWQYQGESGERVGDLKRVENATSTIKTTKTVVVYPYSESYWLNTDSYAIDATLPATQYYAEGSYGVGSNLMVSQSEFTQFSLKSVCGWLKLQLTGDGAVVKSIKFRGNDGEQVAGLIYVDTATAEATLASEMGSSDDNNAGGNLVFDDTILTEVVLDCGDGVTLGKSATAFYIALPPQTFSNGFTVDIECEDYELMTLTTEKELVIERNTIQPMTSVEHNAEQIIPNNEIWYTTSNGQAVELYSGEYIFGANVVSNTYVDGKGVIKLDGNATKLQEAFENDEYLLTVTLPDSVTELNDAAFSCCPNLHTINFGNGIETAVTSGSSKPIINCPALSKFVGSIASEDGRCVICNGELFYVVGLEGLTSYTLPEGITSMNAVLSSATLTQLTLPNNLTSIYLNTRSIPALSSFAGACASDDGSCVIINGELLYFAPMALSSTTSYTIDSRVTKIASAFPTSNTLKTVTFPSGCTEVTTRLFGSCANIESVQGNIASTDGKCVVVNNTLIELVDKKLTSYTIPAGITEIGANAFERGAITSITVPASVTKIGGNAFSNSNTSSIYFKSTTPAEITLLYNPWVIDENIVLYVPAESVAAYKASWSEYASIIVGYDFENGAAVTQKPANNEIWYTNGSTTEATTPGVFGENIVSNTYDAAKECWVIKFDGEVTTIGDDAFYACTSLTSVTIPDSVTTIGGGAFAECSSLTSVTIPDSVTTIGDYAFRGCTSLTSVTIGDSVTAIGEGAFESCSSLTSVTIPDSVTTIGEGAFYYCQRLTSVTIPDSVTEIGDWAFPVCSSLQEFNGKFASEDGRCLIIDGVLNSFAPAGLTEDTIPNSVTTIGVGAFYGCRSLTSVTIPDSVTTIGDTAFEDCSSLTSVTIGDSVTAIGDSAFSWCDSLTSVYCKAITPPAGDYSMFYNNASGRKIYVPMESVEAYKSASYWKIYADAIVGYNF